MPPRFGVQDAAGGGAISGRRGAGAPGISRWYSASMRAITSGGWTQTSGHSRPPSSTHLRVASTPNLGAEGEVGARVVEGVDRSVDDHDVALRVDVREGPPGGLRHVLHVHVGVEDDERLGLRHLAGAPEAVHQLLRVAGVLLAHPDEAEVVERPLDRHRHVEHLGEDELEHRQEEPLGRLAEPLVLDRRRADHRRWVDRVLPVRDRDDLHRRVVVGERVEAGVVAEGPLAHERRGGVDEALDHDVGVGRDLEPRGDAGHRADRLAAQEAGEEVLVHVGRERRRGASR